MLAAYRNTRPEDVPIGIYTRYLPRGAAEREARELGLTLIDFYPAVSLLAPPWHTHEGYVSEVRGASFRIEHAWRNGLPIEYRTYETPVGKISEHIERDPAYGSDWVRKYYISEPGDYDVLRYIVENTVFCSHHDAVRARIDDLGDDGVLLARLDRSPFQKLLVELAGPERFLMDVTMGSAPALALLDAMRERLTEEAEMAVASPAALIWQPDNISGDMTSPSFFAQYCLPFYQENAARFREAGKVYVVHMDGRLGPLRSMIAESGIDVVESLSLPEMGGDMTLEEAQDAWPQQAIFPNFPAAWCANNTEWIEERVAQLLSERRKDRALMLEVSEDIPKEHWQRVCTLLGRCAANSSKSTQAH